MRARPIVVFALVFVVCCSILVGALGFSSQLVGVDVDEQWSTVTGSSDDSRVVSPNPEPSSDSNSDSGEGEGESASASSIDGPACPTALAEASGEAGREAAFEPTPDPRIVELYPNPTTHGNVGEYVVLSFPEGTRGENGAENATWTLTDGHTTATLPKETAAGTVAFSMDPAETTALTTYPVEPLEGHLKLAADGDDLALERDGHVVDRVSYDRAPIGEVWYRERGRERGRDGEVDEDDGRARTEGDWWPRGATCRPTMRTDEGAVTAFVLPDSPDVPLEAFATADDRILLAGYTFTSEKIAAELRAALERGVDVDVVLEAGPVGGTPERTKRVLDDLEAEGATVRVLGGRGARYAYHHAKYAVVDDRAIVTTENWKPSGIGGTSSRGWGVVVDGDAGREVAAELEAVFRADFEGRDTSAWDAHRNNVTFVENDPPGEAFPGEIDAETVPLETAEVLLAPDNAESRLLAQLRSAEESILIKQVRIGSRNQPLLEESLEASRRGVDVKVLLDATWYVEDENRELARWLERTAEDEGLPLDVRLVDPRNRFEKIHAKGVVIDEERVIVGSINWNDNSLRNNREVALVLHGEEIGEFYAGVFMDDWDGGSWPVPVSLLGVVAIGLLVAALTARRYVQFVSEDAGDTEPEIGVTPDVEIGSETEAETETETEIEIGQDSDDDRPPREQPRGGCEDGERTDGRDGT